MTYNGKLLKCKYLWESLKYKMECYARISAHMLQTLKNIILTLQEIGTIKILRQSQSCSPWEKNNNELGFFLFVLLSIIQIVCNDQ